MHSNVNPIFVTSLITASIIATALIVAPTYTRAEIPDGAVKSLIASYVATKPMFEKRAVENTYPSLRNADDAAILKPLWDRKVVLGTAPYTAGSLGPALQILKIQSTLLGDFRLRAADQAAASNGQAPTEDETTSANVMILHTAAAVTEAANDMAATIEKKGISEAQKNGIIQMRGSMTALMTKVLESLKLYRYSADNAERLTTALSEAATAILPAIAKSDRAALKAAVIDTRTVLNATGQTRLDDLAKLLESAACNRICATSQ